MKSNFYIQYNGSEVSEKHILNKLKEAWLAAGNKIKDIKETEIYFKPEDNVAYCVINKTEKINITI